MKKEKVLAIGLTLMMAVGLMACGSSGSEQSASASASSASEGTESATSAVSVGGDYSKLSIAYLTPSLDVPFWRIRSTRSFRVHP